MRCGKTKTVLDEFGEIESRGLGRDLLVVAPAGVYRVWEAEIGAHLSDDLRRRTAVHTWTGTLSLGRKIRIENFLAASQPRVLLVNVEALSTVQSARELCLKFLRQRPATMVVDESTTIKNISSKRTRFIVNRLAPLANRRRILTGLPDPQSPLDFYSQFAFLGPGLLGFRSFAQFRSRYAKIRLAPFGPNRTMIEIVDGYQNLDELRDRVNRHSMTVKLSDCYDLPPKIYLTREVEMTPQQRQIYSDMKKFATARLATEEYVTATMVVTQLLRLHQVASGFTRSDSGKIIPIESNRVGEMLSVIDQSSSDKIVIWVAYEVNLMEVWKALEGRYGQGSASRFWGGNEGDREEEEKKFMTLASRRFMVATPASGGRGRRWDAADLAIYFNNTWNLEHRLQSEERCQGMGKKNNVAYVDLSCRGTIDARVIDALKKKIDLSSFINADNWREWIQ